MALIVPKEAPLMPMIIWQKGQPNKKFHFNTTPDTGASVSLMVENVAKRQKLKIDSTKKIQLKTASEALMDCSWGVEVTSRHKITNTIANIEVKVSKSLSDKIIISCSDAGNTKSVAPVSTRYCRPLLRS